MPFCRKCGRRLVEYSESCPDCGTSTTAPIIRIKKASAAHSVKTVAPKKIAKAIIHPNPVESIISIKVISTTKPAKANSSPKTTTPTKSNKAIIPAKPITPNKPIIPAKVYPEHEIIKNNLSIKEDLIANPQDYETQTFDYDLKCPHNHYWSAGKALPVSNGNALCLKCGERLRKPQRKKHQRYRKF